MEQPSNTVSDEMPFAPKAILAPSSVAGPELIFGVGDALVLRGELLTRVIEADLLTHGMESICPLLLNESYPTAVRSLRATNWVWPS